MRNAAVLFRHASRQPGWVAIALMGDRACAAHVAVAGAGRPRVSWIEHLPWLDATAGLRQLRLTHKLAAHNTLGLLARHQYHLSTTEAPDVPREEWASALRWKLQEQLDFPVDTASIDVLEVPAHTSQRGRPAVIAIAAAQAGLLPLTHAARKAGVRWRAFDIVECALRNLSALNPPPGDSERGQALLHVGNDYSTLVITAGGELLQSRVIDVTLAQLLDPTLASGAADNSPANPTPELERFFAAADRIGLEIQRTLDNFERQFTEVSLARLLVAPAALSRFVEHVRALVYTPVEAFDPAPLFDLEAPGAAAQLTGAVQQADALLALGAALRAH